MKINRIFLCFTTLLLCSCGNSLTSENSTTNNLSLENSNESITDSSSSLENSSESVSNTTNNIKVIYFSCTNNTKNIALKIASYLDCDIEEIIPLNSYTNEDLNYNSNNSRANIEQNDDNARPEIQNTFDFTNIDTIFLGYPIWWGKLPKIIYTFLDTYDFTNDTIVPFCTSGSTGITTSVSEIKKLEPNANVLDGRRFEVNSNNDVIKKYIDSLNI